MYVKANSSFSVQQLLCRMTLLELENSGSTAKIAKHAEKHFEIYLHRHGGVNTGTWLSRLIVDSNSSSHFIIPVLQAETPLWKEQNILSWGTQHLSLMKNSRILDKYGPCLVFTSNPPPPPKKILEAFFPPFFEVCKTQVQLYHSRDITAGQDEKCKEHLAPLM